MLIKFLKNKKYSLICLLMIAQILILYAIIIFDIYYINNIKKLNSEQLYHSVFLIESSSFINNFSVFQNTKVFLLLIFAFITTTFLYLLYKLKEDRNVLLCKSKQLDALISHLSKLFSHDLRKPFNLIKMLLNNLNNPNENIENSKKLTYLIGQEIEKNVAKYDLLVQDIIELGHNINPQFELHNLKDILQNTLIEISSRNEDINNKFNFFFNHSDPIKIDLIKIKRALSIIISFSIKNYSKKDNFYIETKNKNIKNKMFTEIVLSCQNYFIPNKEIKNVFKLFYNNKAKGESNLELAICKKIIDLHNGTLKCESSKKKGTVFYITLPNENC